MARKYPKKPQKPSTAPEGKVRIQKYLAERGIASRRASEKMVGLGQIRVNGKVVSSLPCFIDPQTDEIYVDERRIKPRRQQMQYFLLNKPKGVVSTSSDPGGRLCAVEFVKQFCSSRVFCVGRLDADSLGLILLTNDGELTQHLTHPRYEVPKTYVVTVDGRVEEKALEKIKKGVHIDSRRTQGAWVKVLRSGPESTLLEITLREGRNREIRRMLRRLGHKVRRLKRVAIGPIRDTGLKVGHVRRLTPAEVRSLQKTGKQEKE